MLIVNAQPKGKVYLTEYSDIGDHLVQVHPKSSDKPTEEFELNSRKLLLYVRYL